MDIDYRRRLKRIAYKKEWYNGEWERAIVEKYFSVFCVKFGAPYPYRQFALPPGLYEQMQIDPRNPLVIKKLIHSIMLHMKMPYADFKVNIYGELQGKAGDYRASQYTPLINLYLAPHYTVDQVIAIVCHECTHHFMLIHHMDYGNENEVATDALAAYLGFGFQMRDGYIPQVLYTRYSGQYIQTQAVGYLSAHAIDYMLRAIIAFELEKNNAELKTKYRQYREKKKKARQMFLRNFRRKLNVFGRIKRFLRDAKKRKKERMKVEFSRECSIFQELIENNQQIVEILSVRNPEKMGLIDLSLVQRCLHDIESGKYDQTVDFLKNKVEKATAKGEIKESVEKIKDLSAELAFINTQLSAYL